MAANINQKSIRSESVLELNAVMRTNRIVRISGPLLAFLVVTLFFSMQSLLVGSLEHVKMAIFMGLVASPFGYFAALVICRILPSQRCLKSRQSQKQN